MFHKTSSVDSELLNLSPSTPPPTPPPPSTSVGNVNVDSSEAKKRSPLDEFKLQKLATKGTASTNRCDLCLNEVARGKSHSCCFSMLILNLVSIVLGFGLYVAKRVSSELLKYIAEREGTPRGQPMMLATGNGIV